MTGIPSIGSFTAFTCYFSFGLLILLGKIRDALTACFRCGRKKKVDDGYAPLLADWENFYTRHLYRRLDDCWNRPISSCPGSHIEVMERKRDGIWGENMLTGKTIPCLNLGSYNYLGFGDPNSPTKSAVFAALERFSVSTSSPRTAVGTTVLHKELEDLVARFVGKESSMIFGMGFGTNSTGIPALCDKGTLLISDTMNHSSIVTGARNSGATIAVFKHNDVRDLERVIRKSICDGQPRTHRPWRKIIIVVEGIYSMEGEFCPLREIVEIKNKYKCYLYVDEAHSIGAVGPRGRGICDHAGVSPSEVDVLMGTFTKSFGAVGGYIAGDAQLIRHLKRTCAGSVYSPSISPPAVQQIISAVKIIMGEDGTDLGQRKMKQLRENSNMFRERLRAMGCHVLGDFDSPIVPVMLYQPGKIPAFSRECLKRNLAVVVVGFPATPLLLTRTRFCISAGHTREDLEKALEAIEEVVDLCGLRYSAPQQLVAPHAAS